MNGRSDPQPMSWQEYQEYCDAEPEEISQPTTNMSRSNNSEIQNPSERFYQWNGTKGGFHFWDKSKGEKGERVDVDLPFKFIVLDTLSTIKGFSDFEQGGFWSNEIRDIKKDVLTVKTKKGIASKGLYTDVMNSVGRDGAKFCQSVYVAMKQDGKLVIANLQLMGAALSAWIDFRKRNKIYTGAIEIASMVEGKKGAVTYQMPVFKIVEIDPRVDELAKALDRQLQTYLSAYFKRNSDETAASHVEEMKADESEESFRDSDDNYQAPLEVDDNDDFLPF